MLKRLFLIGFFTGAGQLFAILILKFVAQKSSAAQLANLAHVDSLFFFILNIIAFGLQSAAMRNIALSGEWKSEYINTQSARLMLGIFLTAVGLVAFNDPVYAVFFIAPLFALSGDYALYALGYPVTGAIVSFIRTVIPYGLIAIIVWSDPSWMVLVFLIGITIAFAATNYYIARFIHAPFVVTPKWKNLLLYFHSLPLGVVNVSLYFIGVGLLLIVPYFYPERIVAVAFVGLKFYLIYKGVLRIIHQAFVKDMIRDEVCLQIDQLSIICSLAFAGAVFIFPESFITLFFGKIFIQYSSFFIILAIAAFIYSFVLSMGTRIMLEKKDKDYTILSITSATISIVSVIVLSYFFKTAESIAISILLGEASFTTGLLVVMNKKNLISKRFLFLLRSAFFLLIPLLCRYIFSDSLPWFFIGMATFTTLLLFLNRHKFSTLGIG